MLGKIDGNGRRGQQRMRRLDSITHSVDMNLSKLQEIVKDRGVRCLAVPEVERVQHNSVTEQQHTVFHISK